MADISYADRDPQDTDSALDFEAETDPDGVGVRGGAEGSAAVTAPGRRGAGQFWIVDGGVKWFDF